MCSDDSYYLSLTGTGLTPEIVNDSIYRYLEEDLGIKIATGKRDVTIEHPRPKMRALLDLDDFNALAVIRGADPTTPTASLWNTPRPNRSPGSFAP